ncbi:MAG TPA: tetratricopeptide repeat protein, partial [Anaerolineae bacterium]|nr:tetratricopeptide repeat protein [Anaerolineae bacterium]
MAEVALRDYVTDIDGMIENSAYDAAIHHCRHILMQYPKYLEAYRVLGKALLEKDDHPAAGDVFQRVLGVDPEDFVARVGLSIVRDRQGELDQAIWHMERAYDLMPSNEIIQSELRRLYTRRDGVEPERVSLTRSALARMYAHGDLYVEAIANLRQLLHEQPDRLDLQVLLAEVLWRNEQRIEASDLALAITAKSPYCLKANLILGDILQASGNGEGETPLRRAQAIDPDNIQAARLFGSDSVLPVRRTVITRLEQMSYSQLLETGGPATDTEEVPDWLRGLAEL